ncbi:hypothetical protein GCM10010326_17350 [Streptomyces xanthochromogenes]|uniref:Uncharacterized protein n=1 Tax=Streptomyces xanthochromogenes TaxID=67384 RepID=A0ABQ2ZVX7_9ACTN|nr:hypothetical protein GCM10010326_17350 [Streptomyces xanthochromogenes]
MRVTSCAVLSSGRGYSGAGGADGAADADSAGGADGTLYWGAWRGEGELLGSGSVMNRYWRARVAAALRGGDG